MTEKHDDSGQLDELDRKLISAVVRNARQSIVSLADEIGLSKSPTQMRLRRLEKSGHIRGYTAQIDHEKLGLGHIAFVQVSLSDTRTDALLAFNQAVQATPEITQCHMIAGNFDYLLMVRTQNIAEYRRVLGETISALPYVARSSTFVAMETVKG
jgi:Lrp/AsnC family leucine-responsive transcriptional regulator